MRFIPRANDERDGSEHLRLCERIAVIHVREYMRRDHRTFRFASKRHSEPGFGVGEVMEIDGQLAGIDRWADERIRLMRIAIFEFCRAGHEPLKERIVHAVLDDDPIGAHADLALVKETAEGGGSGRLIDIRIRQNDKWTVAAKLQRDALDDLCVHGVPTDQSPDPGGAGKRQETRHVVKGEGVADHF